MDGFKHVFGSRRSHYSNHHHVEGLCREMIPSEIQSALCTMTQKKHEAITVSFSLEFGSICHKFENIIPGEILKSFHPRNRSSNTPILTWCHGRSLHFCQSVPTACPLHCRLPGIPGIPLCGRGWWICVDQKWIVDLPWIKTTNKNCQEQWNMMNNDGKLLDYVDIAWYSLFWNRAT